MPQIHPKCTLLPLTPRDGKMADPERICVLHNMPQQPTLIYVSFWLLQLNELHKALKRETEKSCKCIIPVPVADDDYVIQDSVQPVVSDFIGAGWNLSWALSDTGWNRWERLWATERWDWTAVQAMSRGFCRSVHMLWYGHTGKQVLFLCIQHIWGNFVPQDEPSKMYLSP